MATYSELYAQLKESEYIIYLVVDHKDAYKRIAMYKNLAGVSGSLTAATLGALGLSFSDLPIIVPASKLVQAKKLTQPSVVNWDVIDIAVSSGELGGSGEISQEQIDQLFSDVEDRVDAKTSSVFKYLGSVEAHADLPQTGNTVGDVYQVVADNYAEYVWVETGTPHWEYLGSVTDLSNYYTKEELEQKLNGVDNTSIAELTTRINAVVTEFEAFKSSQESSNSATTSSITAMESSLAEIINRLQILENSTPGNPGGTVQCRVDTKFISGTDEEPAEVTLADDEWCVMTGPFTATLPSNPGNGDQIHMSIEYGSANMRVVAPEGTTINGSDKPCLVGIDDNGEPINYVSFYFVFNAAQNNWIVL